MQTKYDMVFISPIGPIGIICQDKKILKLKIDPNLKKISSSDSFHKEIKIQINMYLNGKIEKIDIPYHLRGTNFQKKVLNLVSKIKYGNRKTYTEIACKVGSHPRPVGNACKNNPLQILIPCHRVIGKNNLGGYAGGTKNKNQEMFNIKNHLLLLEKKF